MKQETQTRLRNLRQLMQSDGCEALMIFSPLICAIWRATAVKQLTH
jgi:hypothetical protein